MALVGCVTQESNQNLPYLSKVLLQWHFKLGHCGFSLVKWIGQTGIFRPMGIKMGKDDIKIPKCAACQFGKQERNAKGGTTTKKDPGGVLKKEKLEPGDLIFVDQFESRLPGQVFSPRGSKITSQKYKGGSIYCDAATGWTKVYMQDSFTAEETVETKLRFEKECAAEGVEIKDYNTDNGVFQLPNLCRRSWIIIRS